jgi:mannitol/fructose-specific phosphotransferase system IIA component (Ntr-type)
MISTFPSSPYPPSYANGYSDLMKLSEIVTESLIFPEMKGTTVSSILREFADSICATGKFSDPDMLYERLMERESQASTDMGNAVAIPHCRIENLNQIILAVGYCPAGVDFKATEGHKSHFFFVVAGPANNPGLLLRTIANVARLIKSPHFMARLQKRPGKSELIKLIREEEGDASNHASSKY